MDSHVSLSSSVAMLMPEVTRGEEEEEKCLKNEMVIGNNTQNYKSYHL